MDKDLKQAAQGTPEPIPMVLHCPKCGAQHIDQDNHDELRIQAAESGRDREGAKDLDQWLEDNEWSNPPHRSHLCHRCGTIWRPADVATTGVKAISTKGKADTWEPEQPATPEPVSKHRPSPEWYAAMVNETMDDDFVIGPAQATPEPVGEPTAWRWFNSNGDQVTNWLDFKPSQKEHVEAQVAEAGGRIEYAYTRPAPGVPEIDYDALIRAAFARDRKWAQGTNGCVAFKHGAEWFRGLLTAAQQGAEQAKGADHD